MEKAMKKFGIDKRGRVQQFVDTECLRLTNEKMPKDTGALIRSGIDNTIIGSGEIRYRTPYARRLYYHPEYNFSTEKNPEAGAYAFERMKQQYKKQILAGAKKIAKG